MPLKANSLTSPMLHSCNDHYGGISMEKVGLEVENPPDPQTKAGGNPILFMAHS